MAGNGRAGSSPAPGSQHSCGFGRCLLGSPGLARVRRYPIHAGPQRQIPFRTKWLVLKRPSLAGFQRPSTPEEFTAGRVLSGRSHVFGLTVRPATENQFKDVYVYETHTCMWIQKWELDSALSAGFDLDFQETKFTILR